MVCFDQHEKWQQFLTRTSATKIHTHSYSYTNITHHHQCNNNKERTINLTTGISNINWNNCDVIAPWGMSHFATQKKNRWKLVCRKRKMVTETQSHDMKLWHEKRVRVRVVLKRRKCDDAKCKPQISKTLISMSSIIAWAAFLWL